VFVVLLITTNSQLTTVYAAGATLSLSPSTGTFNRGCSFSIDVLLDTGGVQTDGTDAILFYDPTRFIASKIRSGTIYSEYPGNTIDSQNGKISINGLASISSAFAGQGVLASIDFTIPATAPTSATQIKFDFDPNDKAKTTDSNVVERGTVADILNQVNDGNYTIGTGSCVASPSAAPIYQGAPIDQTETKTPPIEQKPLPQSADFNTTVILVSTGVILVFLGILGMVIL
ncbi:MAG: cohesin domain-containing protein, partial [Candidatus Daviesbacteria bacterium]|nr:cohesin domain-containing protein [Candidatus Daviesbacteria bacterium]